MPRYKESAVTGVRYRRPRSILLYNPPDGSPRIQYDEEVLTETDDGKKMKEGIGPLSVEYDGQKEIPLVNPQTDEPTGQTVTWRQIYVALYSAYLQDAKERDTREEANPAP